MKVLIVDDYEDGAHLIARLVQLFGHKAIVAHSGLEAVAEAHEFSPDLVLMDIRLPGMDGYAAARRIHSEPGLRHTPIVALTADQSDPAQERAAGMQGYCRKPINADQLKDLLDLAALAVRPCGPQSAVERKPSRLASDGGSLEPSY